MDRPETLLRPLILGALVVGCLVPTAGAPRFVQLLATAALVGALAAIGGRAVRWLRLDLRRLETIFVAGLLACGVAVCVGYALGTAAWLRPSAFRLVVAVLLLGAWAAPVPASAGGPALEPPSRRPRRSSETALLWAALGAVLCSLLAVVWSHRLTPPGPFAFDDTSYHLSAVATWWQAGDLRMLKFAFGDPSTTFYPIASELLAWVLLAPFGGSDFAARFAQLPVALLALAGVAVLARRLSASSRGALCAALLLLAIPRAFPQLALSAGNDMALPLFAVAAAHAALLLRGAPSWGGAVYAGAGLGLLVGTKYLGLVLVLPLGLAVGVGTAEGLALGRLGGAGRAARRWLALLALAAASALFVGGYTYARNASVTGNPVYPLPVEVLGVELPGMETATLAARRPDLGAPVSPWDLLWRRIDLWGPVFRWTLLPLCVLAGLAALRRWRCLGATRVLVLLLGPVCAGLVLAFSHDHRDVRYLFAPVALAAAAAGWLVDRVPGRSGALVRSALAIAALVPWFEDWQGRELLALAAGLASAGAWWRGTRDLSPVVTRWRPALLALAVVAVVPSSVAIGRVVDRYQAARLQRVPAAEALEASTAGAPAVVAYAGWNQPYLFAGRTLQNRVHLVPHDAALAAMTYDWRGTAAFPYDRGGARAARWLRNLDALGVDWVVTVVAGGSLREWRWMEERPQRFRRVYDDGSATLWRVAR
ncbi:MAG TPA: glycosyltransferase family 39 protein [Thermoanaerobaculia bacterium]|nr:glycosyltransferase family 39 protein [Thermoanaerobaculia bacterium]